MGDVRTADLVLEGGGVKGIGLVGALSVLEERGWRFNRVAGTSAGSIVGALVAAGYSGAELKAIMAELDYRRFRDGDALDHLGVFGKAVALLMEHGIYEGSYLKQWLGERLAAKGVSCFGDLQLPDRGSSLPADRQYRLVVMTSDISQGCLRRLPWDYHHYRVEADEARVADAVRASMSIPFFYEPVTLPGPDGRPCWLVDGGMLSNFPIDTFDRTDGRPPRWPTIGVKLSARPTSNADVAKPIHGTLEMARAMLSTLTGFYDQIHLDDPATVARTIFVDTTGVQATDFDLDADTAQRLYQNGRDAATTFLDGGDGRAAWDWEAYVSAYRTPVSGDGRRGVGPEPPRAAAAPTSG